MKARSILIPALAATILFATPSVAALVKFDDGTETVSATVDGAAVNTCVSENLCQVSLPNFLANPVNNAYRAAFKLTERRSTEISDFIQFAVFLATPTTLDIFLVSDPITATIPSDFYGSTDEDGTFQTIALPRNLPALAAGNTLTVQVKSEVEKVPEPGALPLMTTALFVLAGYRWIRKSGIGAPS